MMVLLKCSLSYEADWPFIRCDLHSEVALFRVALIRKKGATRIAPFLRFHLIVLLAEVLEEAST